MIRLAVVIIEFCALADSGQMQRYIRKELSRPPLASQDMLEMFQIYASDAVLVALLFPFSDPDKENCVQMLPCQN